MNRIQKFKLLGACAVASLAILVAFLLNVLGQLITLAHQPQDIAITHTTEIGLTANQIVSIQEIGQYEALCIHCEELVDTTRHNTLLPDDHLARIYYGTLRLGVDLRNTSPGWATSHGDTAVVVLPKVQLLDDNFIDEASTKAFSKSGDWDSNTYEDLLLRAEHRIKKRCLTPQNMELAENNVRDGITRIFRTMGYKVVEITFEK